MITQCAFNIVDNGDSAVTLLLAQPTSEGLTRYIISISQQMKQALEHKLLEIIPGYQSITFIINPLVTKKHEITACLSTIMDKPLKPSHTPSRLIEIPVCYDLEYALDIQNLAQHCQLSVDQVISLHSQSTYLVHMLGFLPGFLYLGGLSPRLKCPRKKTPSVGLPAGSVAIGGDQTGIYPVESPGGWHVIGRTPITLFDLTNSTPSVARPLDKIKFNAIDKFEFTNIQKKQAVIR